MNLALFDFDGTITFKDSFAPFLYSVVSPARAGIGGVLLLPVIVGYKVGTVSASTTRSAVAWCALKGRAESEIRDAGARYARDVLPRIIRRKAMQRIDWHKARGDAVVVVSAALDAYLRPWCTALELNVICTELEVRDGRLTGRYKGGDCVGPEKRRRIEANYRLTDFTSIYAYGDTIEDQHMLSLADHKYFRWREVGGPIQQRRKSDHVDEVVGR